MVMIGAEERLAMRRLAQGAMEGTHDDLMELGVAILELLDALAEAETLLRRAYWRGEIDRVLGCR